LSFITINIFLYWINFAKKGNQKLKNEIIFEGVNCKENIFKVAIFYKKIPISSQVLEG
jgi:hypothetical protein